MLRSGTGRSGPGSPERIREWCEATRSAAGSGEAGESPALTRNCERRSRCSGGTAPQARMPTRPTDSFGVSEVSRYGGRQEPSRSGAHGGDGMRDPKRSASFLRAPTPRWRNDVHKNLKKHHGAAPAVVTFAIGVSACRYNGINDAPSKSTASSATAWLLTQQQTDGGFEVAGSPGFETPDAILAIAENAQQQYGVGQDPGEERGRRARQERAQPACTRSTTWSTVPASTRVSPRRSSCWSRSRSGCRRPRSTLTVTADRDHRTS